MIKLDDLAKSLLEGVLPDEANKDEDGTQMPPDGTYPAVVGGYVTVFTAGKKVWKAKFSNGVRGFNIPDTVTITNGVLKSNVLSSPIKSKFIGFEDEED